MNNSHPICPHCHQFTLRLVFIQQFAEQLEEEWKYECGNCGKLHFIWADIVGEERSDLRNQAEIAREERGE